MTTPITIREVSQTGPGFAATVQFGPHGEPYPIAVSNPFSEEEEARLEWYFERWLDFPFTDKVKAAEAAASVRDYGQDLFEQVFRHNPDVYLEYQRLRQDPGLLLEIVGSPEFHALHWEALHDPHQARPLAVDKPVVRKNSEPVTYRAEVQPAPHLRVLLVTARPAGRRDVSYRTISRPLVEALETGQVPAQIDIVRPGTYAAMVRHLEEVQAAHGDGYYHIIHFDVHGALLTYEQYQEFAAAGSLNRLTFRGGEYAQAPVEPYDGLRAFLFFDDPGGGADGGADPVSDADLADLLNARQIPIAVLNACQSGKQVGDAETSLGSRLIAAGVQLVVAMGYSVTVSAARLLMITLYRQLLAGQEPAAAIRRARLELFNDKGRRAAYGQEIALEDWLLPVIYQNRPPTFDRAAFRDEGLRLSAEHRRPRTAYGFVGRDLDILQVERHLLHRRNLLLVQGMGGAGKTTLLHHLGWWWQKTRFVDRVFYFGYDQKAYHLPEIVSRIGRDLGLKMSGILAEDRARVLRALKRARHLLILDNLESITGERLAVQNTLPVEAQAELRDFLQELVVRQAEDLQRPHSLVLLGSRGGEAWLRPDPLREVDVYDLPGLDYEAQTELAEAVLAGVGAPRYPEQAEHAADFRRLLKLLGGYPLAMEVVLANLAQATPAAVIARLQAADVNLDNQKEAAEKTESILKCIDYSHSNLSPEAQALLLCLAPFTGVINTGWLEQYTAQLIAQPALADLPTERWPEVLGEAANWGLLRPHEQYGEAGYLALQPIFPYFLKTRLAGQAERQSAIEAAFREHYNEVGRALVQAIQSREAPERQVGQVLVGVEYENLMTALRLALSATTQFWSIYDALDAFEESRQTYQQRLELARKVTSFQVHYLEQGKSYVEALAVVWLRQGNSQLDLKQYENAEQAYQTALEFLDSSDDQSGRSVYANKASTLHQLGMVAEKQRQWAAAEGYYKEALQIFIDFNDRCEQADTYGALGNLYRKQRKWEKATENYKKSLDIDISFGNKHGQAKTLHNLGIVAQEQRQWAAAEGYYQEALQIFIDFNDRHLQAMTLHQLGMVAQEQRQWAAAEGYYQEALQFTIDFNDRHRQAMTLHNLGIVAQEQRQWAAAEGYYQEALHIFIDFNDRYSQASTLHQLGRVADEQRQWAAAEGYYQEALHIKIDFNDRYGQASTLHQLGKVAQARRQWAPAERYNKEALQIKIDFNDRYGQASTLHQLGMVAQEQRQWPAAEGYYKEALQIFIDFNDRYEQAGTLHQLGRVAQEQRQWAAAEGYYQEALQITIDFNDRYAQAGTLGQLGLLAEAQEDWTQAVDYTLQAAAIFAEYRDLQLGIALRTLARLRQSGGLPSVPSLLAKALGISVEEAEEMLAGGE